MDPNQSRLSATPADPGSHLQFQISLLRLMAQKSMAQKSTGENQKSIGPKLTSVGSKSGTSVQVMALERLRRPLSAKVLLKTRG
jgi:hypothetical protein